MSDKDKIKEEIERRIEDYQSRLRKLANSEYFGRWQEDEELLKFIDSIPEEPTSEDLDEAAEKYSDNASNIIEWSNGWEDFNDCEYVERAFKAGAKWQKQQMMKDAINGIMDCDDDNEWIEITDKLIVTPSRAGKKVKFIVVKEE